MSYYLGLSILSDSDKIKKEQSSAEARRILSHFEKRNIDTNDISFEARGRPFFLEKETDFNISHSNNIVAVSYINKKDIRVGCDIEKIKPRPMMEKIARDKFTESENKYLNSNQFFNYENFYKLWTLKESYIKLRGLSIFDITKIPSFIKENKITNSFEFSFCADEKKPIYFRIYEISNTNRYTEIKNNHFFLAEAIEGENYQSEIIWFSPSSLTLDCKMILEIKNAMLPGSC